MSADSDHVLPVSSQKASSSSSTSQWSSSLAVSLVRPIHRELAHCSSKNAEDGSGTGLDASLIKAGGISPSPSRLSGSLPLQAQVARSELNVRLPRGMSACSICSSSKTRYSQVSEIVCIHTVFVCIPAFTFKTCFFFEQSGCHIVFRKSGAHLAPVSKNVTNMKTQRGKTMYEELGAAEQSDLQQEYLGVLSTHVWKSFLTVSFNLYSIVMQSTL